MLAELLSYYYSYYSLSSPLFCFFPHYSPNSHIVCEWVNYLALFYATIKTLSKPTEIAKHIETWTISNEQVITIAIMISTIKMYSEVLSKTFKVWKNSLWWINEVKKVSWVFVFTFLLLYDSSYLIDIYSYKFSVFTWMFKEPLLQYF